MTAEADGTSLAIFLVPVEEVQDIAGDRPAPNRCRIVEHVSQNIGRIRLARNEPRAGEKVPVRGTGNNTLGHLAARLAVALPRKPELQFVLNSPQIEGNILALELEPEFGQFLVFRGQDIEFLARPLAVEIHCSSHVPEPLRLNPADSLRKRMHILASHDGQDDRIQFAKNGNMRLNQLEGTLPAHLLAADIVVRLRAVKRKVYAELFAFQVIDDFRVQERRIGIYRKPQAEL